MSRLLNRNKQIPNSLRFYLPALKWQSTPYQSFDQIVQGALGAIKANPHIAQKQGWPTTYEGVADLIDAYNAKICETNGWTSYISTGGGQSAPLPFHRPAILQSVRRLAAGANSIVTWLSSGAEAVAPELAEQRASVCVGCPMNQQGDLTSIFTVPVSNAIRAALNTRSEWKLSTTQDEKISVCGVCSCPLKLLVHCPIEMKMSKIPKDVFENLPAHCWVKIEANEKDIRPN